MGKCLPAPPNAGPVSLVLNLGKPSRSESWELKAGKGGLSWAVEWLESRLDTGADGGDGDSGDSGGGGGDG